MDPDGDDQLVTQPDGAPDDVQVAVGDGIEGAGIKRDTGHKLVYRAPGGRASRGVPPIPPISCPPRPEPLWGSGRLLGKPIMFRPGGGDETKLGQNETNFCPGEDIRKRALRTQG